MGTAMMKIWTAKAKGQWGLKQVWDKQNHSVFVPGMDKRSLLFASAAVVLGSK